MAKIRHIAIFTDDPDELSKFYVDTFGLTITQPLRSSPESGSWVFLTDGYVHLALISPARRARETWDRVKRRLDPVSEHAEPRLYEAPADGLLTIVRETEPAVRTLLILGHNPGLEELAKLLAGAGPHKARARLMRKYPTAGLAVLDLDIERWRDVDAGLGRLDRFVTPRSLKSEDR